MQEFGDGVSMLMEAGTLSPWRRCAPEVDVVRGRVRDAVVWPGCVLDLRDQAVLQKPQAIDIVVRRIPIDSPSRAPSTLNHPSFTLPEKVTVKLRWMYVALAFCESKRTLNLP